MQKHEKSLVSFRKSPAHFRRGRPERRSSGIGASERSLIWLRFSGRRESRSSRLGARMQSAPGMYMAAASDERRADGSEDVIVQKVALLSDGSRSLGCRGAITLYR